MDAIHETRHCDVVVGATEGYGRSSVESGEDHDGSSVDRDALADVQAPHSPSAAPSAPAPAPATSVATRDLAEPGCHPLLGQIAAKFSGLAEALPFPELPVEQMLAGFESIAAMVGLFGASLLSVRANITDNLSKIRKTLSKLPDGANRRGIGALIADEVARGVQKKEGTICLSTLWLKRCMDFMDAFCKDVINGGDTSAAAKAAFEKTLAPWQGWVLRTACKTGMRMVPNRSDFLTILASKTGREQGGGPDVLEARETAVLAGMRRMLASFSIVIKEMDMWFDAEGLNFSEKA